MDYRQLLKDIIADNNYLCLATADETGKPWASPLVCATGDEKVFYYISNRESLHSRNLAKNPKVAFSIFNSTQRIGTAYGVQASGHAEAVEPHIVPTDIQRILYNKTALPVLSRGHSFYRITVDEMFLPHEERWKDEQTLRAKVENL